MLHYIRGISAIGPPCNLRCCPFVKHNFPPGALLANLYRQQRIRTIPNLNLAAFSTMAGNDLAPSPRSTTGNGALRFPRLIFDAPTAAFLALDGWATKIGPTAKDSS